MVPLQGKGLSTEVSEPRAEKGGVGGTSVFWLQTLNTIKTTSFCHLADYRPI